MLLYCGCYALLHKIGNWAFIQIIIIKRGLFWNMTYFYMRQTQRARKNKVIIIVESLLTYLWAFQALFWNIKIFTLFELTKKCEKVCFVCMLFLDSALRRRLTSKRNEAWILEWTGFIVYEPIQNKTAVFNVSKRSPFCIMYFAKMKTKE